MSAPGIGFLTALTLYAEICDIRRFLNPEKMARYCGLVPEEVSKYACMINYPANVTQEVTLVAT